MLFVRIFQQFYASVIFIPTCRLKNKTEGQIIKQLTKHWRVIQGKWDYNVELPGTTQMQFLLHQATLPADTHL